MGTTNEELKGLLGERYITGNAGEVSRHFRNSISSTSLAIAVPKSHDEVREIVRTANESGTPVFTNYNKYLPGEINDRTGIILDLTEMKEIERLDPKNLMAHIQCGITFADLQKELKKKNLKVQTPAAMKNDSVVRNFVNRTAVKAQARYSDVQVSNMYVALPDGRLHKSGSHSINEMTADYVDGAHFLSRWYIGSTDMFGVISRGSIYIYPVWEKRNVIAYDFNDIKGFLLAMRNLPRTEIGIEYLGMDNVYLKSLTGKTGAKFTLVIGFDGKANYVEWQEKMIRDLSGEYGAAENRDLSNVFLEIIDDPWSAQGAYQTEFTTLFSRVEEFDGMITSRDNKNNIKSGDIGRLYVALDRGRGVTCFYSFFNAEDETGKFIDVLNLDLLDKGVVFNTPEGDLSKAVFDKIRGYSGLIKRIKGMVDSKGILNPGIIKY